MIGAPMATWVIARKEITEHIRSKRFYIIGGLFFGTFLLATILGAVFRQEFAGLMDPFASPEESGNMIRLMLLFYFSIGGFTFASVLALALSADRICGEWKNRTLFLLLSKPVTRTTMLMGKTLGTYLSVFSVFALVFIVNFLIMLVVFGVPDAASLGMILGGLGIVLAGLLPFVGLGILCSALFRSPVASFIVALGLWFLVFPLLGIVGVLIDLFRGVEPGSGAVSVVFSLLSPNSLIQAASAVWVGEQSGMVMSGAMATMGLPEQMGLVLLAMAVHVVVYMGISLWIVRRRDYD